jgi:hypothetical protein
LSIQRRSTFAKATADNPSREFPERRLAERVGFESTPNRGSRIFSMDLGKQKL